MKLHRSQAQFLISTFLWLIVLQGMMLWQMNITPSFVCNGGAPWPLSSSIPLVGSGYFTLFLTLVLAVWAWRLLQREAPQRRSLLPFLFATAVASGLSHTLERLSSGCIVDYWRFSLLPNNIFFNLGDLSLTVAILWIAGLWLYRGKAKA